MKNQKEIEQSFDKVLAMYPTKNLEDFYDMEGYRDSEFSEDDKGVWVLDSSMSIKKSEDEGLVTEGVRLKLNRNTRQAKGDYYVFTTWKDLSKPVEKKQYQVLYDELGLHLLEEIQDENIKDKVKKFQLFVQYGDFNKQDTYENIKKMYNPEVPIYELEYQLTNEDINVQELRKKYDIPTSQAPTLKLKGTGDLGGSSVGDKRLEIRFSKKNFYSF